MCICYTHITYELLDVAKMEANIKNGARQECSLSPNLFNMYVQYAIDKISEDIEVVITENGERMDILRFADDKQCGVITNSFKSTDRKIRENYI